MERLPPIDDLAFGGRDSFSSPDDLSDGGSFADSPPSSTSSESNDYRSSSESEQRRESASSCPSRSSGMEKHLAHIKFNLCKTFCLVIWKRRQTFQYSKNYINLISSNTCSKKYVSLSIRSINFRLKFSNSCACRNKSARPHLQSWITSINERTRTNC